MRGRSLLIIAVVVVLLGAGVLAMLVTTSGSSAPPPVAQQSSTESAGAPPSSSPPPPQSPPTAGANEREADSAKSAQADSARPPARQQKETAPAPAPFIHKNGVRRVGCGFACDLEERCGLRDADACVSSSCEAERDVRVPTTMDYCLADADHCLGAVVCSCAEACWKRGECAGDHDHDAECARSCAVLARQDSQRVYRENRCLLEHRCGDVAACGG